MCEYGDVRVIGYVRVRVGYSDVRVIGYVRMVR